jgi:hypothetical protein
MLRYPQVLALQITPLQRRSSTQLPESLNHSHDSVFRHAIFYVFPASSATSNSMSDIAALYFAVNELGMEERVIPQGELPGRIGESWQVPVSMRPLRREKSAVVSTYL